MLVYPTGNAAIGRTPTLTVVAYGTPAIDVTRTRELRRWRSQLGKGTSMSGRALLQSTTEPTVEA